MSVNNMSTNNAVQPRHRHRSLSLASVSSLGSALGNIFGNDFELEITLQSDDDGEDEAADEGVVLDLNTDGANPTNSHVPGNLLQAIVATALDALDGAVCDLSDPVWCCC
jgi:hypothetical protein